MPHWFGRPCRTRRTAAPISRDGYAQNPRMRQGDLPTPSRRGCGLANCVGSGFQTIVGRPCPVALLPPPPTVRGVFGRRAWTATNRVEQCSSNRQTQTPHTAAPSEYLCGSRHQQARSQPQCHQLNCPGLWPPSRGLSALRTRRRSAVSLQPLQRRGRHTCEQLLDVVARGLSWEHAQPHMDLNLSYGHGCDRACVLSAHSAVCDGQLCALNEADVLASSSRFLDMALIARGVSRLLRDRIVRPLAAVLALQPQFSCAPPLDALCALQTPQLV